MTVSDDVLDDLLTLYLAGEASADSRRLVEEHARVHPTFAAKLEAAGAASLTDAWPGPPPREVELQALSRTRQAIRLRTLFWSGGTFFTLVPLVFSFDQHGAQFLILGRHSGLVWAFWSVAAASWTAWYVMHRDLRRTAL